MDKLQTLLEWAAPSGEQGGLLTSSVCHSKKSPARAVQEQKCLCVVTATGCSGSSGCRAPRHLQSEGLVEDAGMKFPAPVTCDSSVSNVLIHVDTGRAALELLLSFYPTPILLNQEAISKIRIKNYIKEKSGKDSRKTGGFPPHFLNSTTTKFYSLFLVQSKTNKKAGKGFH